MNNSRRLTTALLVAFVLSGALTWLLSRRLEHQAAMQHNRMTMYVAPARSIHPGEIIKPGDLRLIPWPATSPLQGGVLRIDEAAGRSALYPLDPGQPLLDQDLTAAGAGAGLAGKIPNGMRAIALRSDEVVGVAGFLTPGSHLDVLVTYHASGSPDPITATVLQNAEVVAAGNQLEPDPTSKSVTATVVTLLLTPQEAERAVLASTQGSIHFVLRNSTDTTRIENAAIGLSQLTAGAPLGAGGQMKVMPAPPQPPSADAFLRRSRSTMQTPTVSVPFQIETVLGDQAGLGKTSERTQP